MRSGVKRKGRKRRWLGAVAGGLAGVAAGAVGATILLGRRGMARRDRSNNSEHKRGGPDRWARPGMSVTFRAELMPGRSRTERTFRVAEVLPSSRVTLEGFTGEHTETEFEAIR